MQTYTDTSDATTKRCPECGGLGDKVMPCYDGEKDYTSEPCHLCQGKAQDVCPELGGHYIAPFGNPPDGQGTGKAHNPDEVQ